MLKIIQRLVILTIPTAIVFGCGGQNWLSGEAPARCDETRSTDANVQNSTSQDLTLTFCSPQYAIHPQPESLAAGEVQSFSTEVSHTVHEDTSGQGCNSHGEVATSLGTQVPVVVGDNSLVVCFAPSTDFAESGTLVHAAPLYEILPAGSACPTGFTTLAEAGLSCQP